MSLNVEHQYQTIDRIDNTPELAPSISSKRERLEKRLQETEVNYRNIFENALLGMFQATSSGEYLLANQMLSSIYGYDSPTELIANITNIKEQLYVKPNRYTELMELLEKRNIVWQFESQVYRKDGNIIWISENVRIIYDSSGDIVGYEGYVQDISERKHSEEMMQAELAKEKEINNIKARFFSMACHELRTFLTIIIATSDLLKLHGNKLNTKDRLHYFDKITENIKSMNELLEGFIAIGKAELKKTTVNFSAFELKSFCESIWEDVKTITKTTHKLAFQNNCNNLTLVSNKTLLRQILMNLLLNAVKYSPENNTLFFELDCQKNLINFRIKDRGIGIPKEDREHLFEAFHRASNVLNFSGTGLGMAIVKRAVELHGGSIAVESEVGSGTTITVTIPTICTNLHTSNWESKIFCVCDDRDRSLQNSSL
ncbi:PAS domain-containing sensor histidine kinase [Aerosakkonema funiforme]|uniref:histidine kinase n=3 Tax=Oscillatoriophycideae TaxID=1301283 RepID=A0A926VBB3_9CYAN|nr:PAS domain-containing sensor histidine kinase [Aerosakkonema funiforme]MBD2180724.1 PAS domain-containing sensor histidine kinase [Aerosakkonema funiforme FACHB-1375]